MTPPTGEPAEHVGPAWRGAATAICVNLVFLAMAIPLICVGYDRGRGAQDQSDFHIGPIDDFAYEWPHFDFADYTSATTPGYHLVMAAVAKFVGDDLRTLRLASVIFTVGLLATVAIAVGRRAGVARGTLLCLPIVCSVYIFSGGVWLLPDNAGWWWTAAALLLALRPRVDATTYALGGLLLLLIALTHQSSLWVAAPLCAAAWLGGTNPPGDCDPRQTMAARWKRMIAMALVTLPAFAALGWFVHLWHGLIPPNQRVFVAGTNPAGPIMALAVVGLLGFFFLPLLVVPLGLRRMVRLATTGAIVGLCLGAIPASSYNTEAGRYSGLWNAVLHVPLIWDRSPLIVLLSGAGGAVALAWLASLPKSQRCIWVSVLLAFGAVQFSTHNAFHRYDEPLVLMAAAISLAGIARNSLRWTWLGPVLLSLTLAGITFLTIR